MSVLNQSGEEQVECPLCMEPLEVDDLNFYPCTCGYQICRFCWHRIRTDENGLCPACRKAYSENPADFTPLSKEQVAQLKAEKRARDQQRKARLSESRKHLAAVRVVQKNLVFVVGLPVRLADAEILRRHEYFGKFGKIHKVVINQSTSYAGSQGPSASAYVTYYRSEDALRAIQSVNNITLDGRLIKSSLGTTKYCSHFMKNQPCPKPDCMYLHDLGDTEASFTKEEMHQGKHQEYERRLHEALAVQQQNKSANSTNQSGQNAAPIQKEAWPSLSRNGSPPNVGKERKNSNSESKQSSQSGSSNNSKMNSTSEGNNSINSNVTQSSGNTISNKHNTSSLDMNHTSALPTLTTTNKSEKPQKNKNSNKANKQQQNENLANNIKNSQKSTTQTATTENNNKINENNNSSNKLITSLKNDTISSDIFSTKSKLLSSSSSTISAVTMTNDTKPVVESSGDSGIVIDKPKENTNHVTNELETASEDNTDRSTNSSPLAQNVNKISLYEDNTSFFSPNTFQKLISDNESSNNFVENNTIAQNSNILNDQLPDINSTEDWEAAFGFSSKSTTNIHQKQLKEYSTNTRVSQNSTDDSPGSSSTSTCTSVANTRLLNQDSLTSVPGFDSVVNQFNSAVSLGGVTQLNENVVVNSRNSFYSNSNTNNLTDNTTDVGLMTSNMNSSVFTSSDTSNLMRNSIYNSLSIPTANNPDLITSNIGLKNSIPTPNSINPVSINGLDQHMYKFFTDFHKNSLKEQHSQHQDFITNSFTSEHIFNPNSSSNLIQSDIARHNFINSNQQFGNEHLLGSANASNSQQNQLLTQQQHNLLQQRMMEKHLNEQQILLNMKSQQQNSHQNPHTLLTVSNQPNFLSHGGYQQNFLLQNQINLVQNQHNLIGGDQHNISLIGNQQNIAQQIIGNTLANQHSNLLNSGANNQLLSNRLPQNSTTLQNLMGQTSHVGGFGQYSAGQNQAQTQHLILSNSTNTSSSSNPAVQRNVEDELGFDPFHETQKALAELMESEQIINSQQQHRARLPPPGFSHMNSFGIGLPRPHGSKILPFMSLSQTNANTSHQNAINSQQSTNGWPVSNPQTSNLVQNSGLGVCNDWTTLDPAIVTSSRHFPLVASMGAMRDQFTSNMPLSASSANNNVSTLRGLDFTTTAAALHQQSSNNFTQQAAASLSQLPPSVSVTSNNGGCYNPQQSAAAAAALFQTHNGATAQYNSLTNGYNTQSNATPSSIGQNWINSAAADYQNQIPLPPGFRQNSQQQGKTQEC